MMMVDGPDSMEAHTLPEGSSEMNSGMVMQRAEDTPQQIITPTTTISTIAVQSGDTRVVIALLQVRNVMLFSVIRTRIIFVFILYKKKKIRKIVCN